jgi:deoxyribodipyrimidine photo-lyase
MIQPERIQPLNRKTIGKEDFVLYWMQASQRCEYNHALEYAIRQANQLNLPVLVYFELVDDFPEANERHYYFMLEGLREVRQELEKMKIRSIISCRHAETPNLVMLARSAALVVTDCGYLPMQRQWRSQYAEKIECAMVQVESDAVIPVAAASAKEEYSAATLRRKINAKLSQYLVPLDQTVPNRSSLGLEYPSFPFDDISRAISALRIEGGVKPSAFYRGGSKAAGGYLQDFLTRKIGHFHKWRNDPVKDYQSHLSPYLHFGQVSPLFVALQALSQDSPGTGVFLEELIVRRELALNFAYYNPLFMAYEGLPDWARRTLEKHKPDPRQFFYSPDELEGAATHDPYWNAAQREMVLTGKMHGYMRMYWGKKILEWSPTPEEAYRVALYLNNKYELDGRDPNGFAGVAWCFGKHDRPWGERPIFGNIRYMNDRGLKRKFDIDAYAANIRRLE